MTREIDKIKMAYSEGILTGKTRCLELVNNHLEKLYDLLVNKGRDRDAAMQCHAKITTCESIAEVIRSEQGFAATTVTWQNVKTATTGTDLDLTGRERWLIKQAFDAGYTNDYYSADEWLEDAAGDGVSVEMAISKEAGSR